MAYKFFYSAGLFKREELVALTLLEFYRDYTFSMDAKEKLALLEEEDRAALAIVSRAIENLMVRSKYIKTRDYINVVYDFLLGKGKNRKGRVSRVLGVSESETKISSTIRAQFLVDLYSEFIKCSEGKNFFWK